MSDEFCVLGFHGTFSEDAEKILEEGFTSISRDNHWLGQGIYFYDNFDLAHWFITRNQKTDKLKKNKGTSFVIIKALITSNKIFLLDLDTVEGVNYFYQKINEIWDEIRTITFCNDEHTNRCFILDVLAETFDIKIILKTFERVNPSSYGIVNTEKFDTGLFKLNVKYKERQICARTNLCIEIVDLEYPDNEYNFPSKINFKN